MSLQISIEEESAILKLAARIKGRRGGLKKSENAKNHITRRKSVKSRLSSRAA